MLDAIPHSLTRSAPPMVVPFPLTPMADAHRSIATALRDYLFTQHRAYSAANYCALDHLVDASNELGEAIDKLAKTLPPGC